MVLLWSQARVELGKGFGWPVRAAGASRGTGGCGGITVPATAPFWHPLHTFWREMHKMGAVGHTTEFFTAYARQQALD